MYFVSGWPSMIRVTEERFEKTAPPVARLLIGIGKSKVLCKMIVTSRSQGVQGITRTFV